MSESGVVIAPLRCVNFDLTEVAMYVHDKTRHEQETNIKTAFANCSFED